MEPVSSCDVVIVGGGIAGASLAANLAGTRTVVLIEREPMLAQHATGRSAAAFLESYGSDAIRALTRASRHEFEHAPDDGETPPLLAPRELLWVAPESGLTELDGLLGGVPSLVPIEGPELLARCPRLRPGYAARGALEPDAADMDVLAIHGRFMRLARAGGVQVRVSAGLRFAERRDGRWSVRTDDGGEIVATTLVDAAGAWADTVATACGVAPLGFQPLRRTIAIGRAGGEPVDPAGPLVGDVVDGFYFKPEGPNVLLSPAEETPSEACDARPDELDVARAIELVNGATTYEIRSVVTTWSGLRTFAPDRNLVVGWAPAHEGFFWLAGQGGYGIQTSAALGRVAAALLCHEPLPADVAAEGLRLDEIDPARFDAR